MFVFFDRYLDVSLQRAFLMFVGLSVAIAGVLWVVKRILVFIQLKFHFDTDVVLDKTVWTGGSGSEKRTGALVLSSKTDTASPVVASRSAADYLPLLFFLVVVISPFGYIWYSVGTAKFLTFMKYLLAIGIPILLLSLFETGRNILKSLFIFLQALMCFLDIVSSISGGRRQGSSGGGEFGGGGASGKW